MGCITLRRIAIAGLAFALAVCVAGARGAAAEPSGAPLRILAAASLTEAFTELAALARERTPGLAVETSFAASSALAAQLRDGAVASVVATADAPTMQAIAVTGALALPARPLASNVLVVAVEPGNPKGVRSLADLARSELVVVLAAPEVPAGRYAREMLAAAGVEVHPRSLEASVRGVVTKVALGEADAGIVYATDVRAAGGRIEGVEVPEAARTRAVLWIAPLARAPDAEAARRFVALALSPDGQATLARHGFGAPPATPGAPPPR